VNAADVQTVLAFREIDLAIEEGTFSVIVGMTATGDWDALLARMSDRAEACGHHLAMLAGDSEMSRAVRENLRAIESQMKIIEELLVLRGVVQRAGFVDVRFLPS